jgi:cation diffusion facilitator family transporter
MMHPDAVQARRHEHVFLGEAHEENERRTHLVVALTAAMMTIEIVGGTIFGSMALVADGWHMSTHVAALGIAAGAYRYARLHRHDPRFSFGTGKLGELAGFGSAIVLAMIALYIAIESVSRLFAPVHIAFAEAIPIAALGLVVNLASAFLLHGGHGAHDHEHHDHDRGDHHHHAHHHHGHDHADTNLRAAYLHVLADALTSVTAIVALSAAYLLGWTWLDPLVAMFGTVVIALWSWSLIRTAATTLLDMTPREQVVEAIRAAIETDGTRLCDLHVWRVGPGHTAAILSVVAEQPLTPDAYKSRLRTIAGLSHVTVEVERLEPRPLAA